MSTEWDTERQSMTESNRVAIAVLQRDVAHLSHGLADTRAEVKELRSDMNAGFDELRKLIADRFNWTLCMFGGGILSIVGFIYFYFGGR